LSSYICGVDGVQTSASTIEYKTFKAMELDDF